MHTKTCIIALFTSLNSVMLCAEEYPYLYRSAHFLGRGDTGIAVADDSDAIFYNPAGIALGKGIFKEAVFASPMLEVSKDTRDVIRKLSLEDSDPTTTLREQQGNPQHVGLNFFSGLVLRRAALGAFAHNSTTVMLYKDHTRGALESVRGAVVSDAGATFSLAQGFAERLYIGLTGKYIRRNQISFYANATEADSLKGTEAEKLAMSGTGGGFDFGMMLRNEGRLTSSLGLTVQDIGNTVFIPDNETSLSKSERPLKDIKQTINLGSALEFGTRLSKFRLLADFRDLLNVNHNTDFKRLHLGTELSVHDVFGITAGLNQGYPCFGVFVNAWLITMNVGFYGEEVGDRAGSRPDTRYFFKIAVGI